MGGESWKEMKSIKVVLNKIIIIVITRIFFFVSKRIVFYSFLSFLRLMSIVIEPDISWWRHHPSELL